LKQTKLINMFLLFRPISLKEGIAFDTKQDKN